MLEIWIKFRNSIVIGLGLSIGIGMGYLCAVSIGTLNTFSSGSVISSSQVNSNFTTLKTAIEQNMVPVGTIVSYGGSIAPTGFLLCDGSEVSRTTYADLFNAIGTTWGSGDGSTTFNLPDTRAASPTGAGTSTAYTENETLSLGSKINDQFQGFDISNGERGRDSLGGPFAYFTATNTINSSQGKVHTSFTSNGTNGTPRAGSVTKGKQFVVNFIIKY
ncbi:MAG: phage tail protein [Spirochaetota bacterium]